jgi:probable selenate reductase FAD-binding subunit
MLTIQNYCRAASLEEAWQLYQKRANVLLGGMQWLKMSRRSVQTAIDLSDLGLDKIEEDEKAFTIGCMTSLRAMELHEGLDKYTDGAMREALRHIVGVQFRNTATVGGSVAGRFGFSDVSTILLALGAEVLLYKGGRMELEAYLAAPRDRDILTHVIIPKGRMRCCYQSVRIAQTDFPVLTCAAVRDEYAGWRFAVGARPHKAMLLKDDEWLLGQAETGEKISDAAKSAFVSYARKMIPTAGNIRGSAAYRSHLVGVLVQRAIGTLEGGPAWN